MGTPRGFISLGLILLLVIGLAAFGGAGWYAAKHNATPTVDTTLLDTSGWQTYTDQQYGFSFKYPTDWKIGGGPPISDKYGSIKGINLGAPSPANSNIIEYGVINIAIRNKSQMGALKVPGNVQSSRTIQSNGISMAIRASKITVEANGRTESSQMETALFVIGDNAFQIGTNASDPNFSSYFHTILSTIRPL